MMMDDKPRGRDDQADDAAQLPDDGGIGTKATTQRTGGGDTRRTVTGGGETRK